MLVAAGELAHNLVDGGGLDAQGLNVSLAALLNLLLVQEHAGGMPLEAGKNQIGADGLGQHQTLALPVLGQQGDARRDGLLGVLDMDLFALDVDFAAVDGVRAEHGPDGLRPSRAHQAAETQNLSAVSLKADVPQHAADGEVFHLQHALALGAELLGEQVVQRPAHHGGDQGVVGPVLNVPGLDKLAVPNDGHPVAELEELLQLVRNKEDAHTPGLQLPAGGHQLLDLLLSQGGGRLVHDDHLRVNQHRFGDLNHLLDAHAKGARGLPGIDVLTQGLHDLSGFLVHGVIVQKQALFGPLVDKDIVRNAEELFNV